MIITTLLTEGAKLLFGGVSDHFKNKREIKSAEHGAKIRRIDKDQDHEQKWDVTMAQGSKDSWKDEFWTIVLSVPAILAFIPIPEVQLAVATGWSVLAGMPDWYRYALGVAISAAFGFRKLTSMIGGKK